MKSSPHTYRPFALLALLPTTLLLAWITGALNNFAGSLVFSKYYSMVLGWNFTENLTAAIVAQGLFESTFAGLLLALVYITVVACVSRASCPYKPAALHLLRWSILLPICWFLGGAIALLLRFISPNQLLHILIPEVSALTSQQFTRFVWVGGTIDGIYAGGIFTILLASLTFPARWRRIRLQLHMTRTGRTPFCLKCGYNQRRTSTNACPECGATIRIDNPADLKISTGEIH